MTCFFMLKNCHNIVQSNVYIQIGIKDKWEMSLSYLVQQCPSVSKGLRYFIDKVNHYQAQTKMIEMIQLYKHLQLAKEEAKSETELL